MAKVLENCKGDLSRENIMKQATSLDGLALPMLLPGIKIYTDPHNFTPIRQIQMARFDGKSWVYSAMFSARSSRASRLERFRAKWKPVRVKKTRQIKE